MMDLTSEEIVVGLFGLFAHKADEAEETESQVFNVKNLTLDCGNTKK
ncbi:MAG: hypothetical protein ACRCZ0_06285 [Cetobacterium sp.]